MRNRKRFFWRARNVQRNACSDEAKVALHLINDCMPVTPAVVGLAMEMLTVEEWSHLANTCIDDMSKSDE